MLIRNRSALSIVFFGLCFSCSSKHEPSGEVTTSDSLMTIDSVVVAPDTTLHPLQEVIYKDSLLDPMARFIAGLPQKDTTSFFNLESDHYWKEYRHRWILIGTRCIANGLEKLRNGRQNFFQLPSMIR